MYFNKTVPNLDKLPERINKFIEQYGDISKGLAIYGRSAEMFLRKCHENTDYTIFNQTKKGGYVEDKPFFRFWLDRYCEAYEMALWYSIYIQGGKHAEKYADEAVNRFRKEMQ